MDILTAFASVNPGVSFEFIPCAKRLDLSKGEADIAIRITKSERHETLICRKVSTAKWSFFGSQCYEDQCGLPKGVEDFSRHRFVTFQNEAAPSYLHDWLSQQLESEQIFMSFQEVDLMKVPIRAGHGLELVNLRMAAADETTRGMFRTHRRAISRKYDIDISPSLAKARDKSIHKTLCTALCGDIHLI